MPLPSGAWKANVNGLEAELTLGPPNQQGLVGGQFFGTDIRGFWDEASQTITFDLTVIFDGSVPVIASFRGYLFRSPLNPAPGRDVVATLAGSLQVSAGNLGVSGFPARPTSRRNVFGWFAQVPEVQ
jgi:hypothetical protein